MPAHQAGKPRWVTNPDGSKRRIRASDLRPNAGVRSVGAEAPADVPYPTPKTHKEADAQASERGLTFPAEAKTVKAKAAYLASA